MINDNSQAKLANMILQHYLLTNQNLHQHYRPTQAQIPSPTMSNYHETLLEMKRTELFNTSLMTSLSSNANVTNQYHSSSSFYGNVLLFCLSLNQIHTPPS